jgi:RNA polymerase sigma-70 factor (ECF subfamily)
MTDVDTGNAARDRREAFESVVSTYETALLRYAARVVRDSAAAQDVVQETFLRLFRTWRDPLEPGPQIASWLYRVAHNCAVDHLRKEQRRQVLHLHHAGQSDEFAPPDRGSAFRVGEDAERAAAALKRLSLREQQLVILKVYEEKSYKEIGEITGLSTGNVGYILHHAMRKLAAELREAKAI